MNKLRFCFKNTQWTYKMNIKSQDSKNGLLNWKSHLAHFFFFSTIFLLLFFFTSITPLSMGSCSISLTIRLWISHLKEEGSPYERVFSCTGIKQDHNNPRNCVPLFLISLIRLEFYPVFFPTLIRTWSREVPAGEKHLWFYTCTGDTWGFFPKTRKCSGRTILLYR